MVARGGSGDALFTVDMDVPIRLRLRLNSDKLLRKVGGRTATFVKGRLRRGLDGDNSPLPKPEAGNPPLNRSGRTIRDIRYIARWHMVAPSAFTREDVSSRARSSFGLMKILISGEFRRDKLATASTRPLLVDPMQTENEQLVDKIGTWAEREMIRQEARGEFGLIAEFRRVHLRGG